MGNHPRKIIRRMIFIFHQHDNIMKNRVANAAKLKRAALNIEEEFDRSDFGENYLPTRQAEKFVEEVTHAVSQGGGAHALSGAYGAGKSSLAIFTMNQLCCKTKRFAPFSFKVKNKSMEKGCKLVQQKGGLLGIAVVGAHTSLGRRIVDGAKAALSDYVGTPPDSLRKIANIKSPSPDNVKLLSLLGSLADDLSKHRKAGVLLIIDEFGRHLERMVSQQDPSDVHLLQGLAEIAGTRKSVFSLIVVQHYGMEHYSRRLLGSYRSEWEKTRGRFKETWLENTERDVADIAASMFRCSDKPGAKERVAVKKWIKTHKIFQSAPEDFPESVEQCWPLHPATIVALTKLSSRLGQNDRTIAGWILSDADSGLKYAANHAKGWVYPAALYDHFFGNPQSLPINPVWARRVSEICAADERFQGDDKALELMHTIAVLNCTGSGVAEEEILRMCLPPNFPFQDAIASLLQQSLIVYRKHRGEFCIWQGSDYDFAGEIAEAAGKLKNFSLAKELDQHNVMPDIVAYRHLIDTGNFRTLPVKFVNLGGEKPEEEPNGLPRVLVYLGDESKEGPPAPAGKHDIVGVLHIPKLAVMGREVAAMRFLLATDHRLQEDAAAKNEIERQLQFVVQQVEDAVSNGIGSAITWRNGKGKWDDIQSAASAVMKKAYKEGFILHNELINRNRSSGSITAALRGLCAAMVESEDKEDLGIEKNPSHSLIYKNFLKENDLHVKNGKGYGLIFDSRKVAPNLSPVVAFMEQLIFHDNSSKLVNVQEDIMKVLALPPYGVKQAPSLILCVICMLFHKDKLALYENKMYVHKWGRTTLERLLGDPSKFDLMSVLPAKIDKPLLTDYHVAVGGDKSAAATVIAIARTLLVRYSKLDAYGLHSESVSKRAQKFRRAVVNAKSPSDLLFKDLPASLGGEDFVTDKKIRSQYFRRIKEVLKELSAATTVLLDRMGGIVQAHYDCADVGVARERIMEDANIVFSSQGRLHPIHKQFLEAASGETDADDKTWLRHVAMSGLSARKMPEDWTDADEAEAEFALRRNIIWLQESSGLLRKNKKDSFFLAMNLGVMGVGIPENEINDAVKDLQKRFSGNLQ